MFTENTKQQVQWQDFIVKSEVDVVFEMARQQGWKDCEIFGYGDMITQPLESKGWKLIPYDLYEYSIPAEGVDRVLKTINAGVRIKGVIIADDERKSAPPSAPARPSISLPSAETILTFIAKVLFGLIVAFFAIALAPFWLIGAIFGQDYDPKLIILVEDGKGNNVWISLLTWYE